MLQPNGQILSLRAGYSSLRCYVKYLVFTWLPFVSATAISQTIPTPIRGVTIDDVSDLALIVDSLKSLPKKPTTRIVFDEGMTAEEYLEPVKEIHRVSFVMGEILDSFYLKNISVAKYRERTRSFLSKLQGDVDIWEIANEINGEWTGPDAAKKMRVALQEVKRRKQKAALTLYYNPNCFENPKNETFTWIKENVSDELRNRMDYVFLSYYEDDCKGFQPNWSEVFSKLAQEFPKSKIGIGECGTKKEPSKVKLIEQYYQMKISLPQFVGGYFWWYFQQDAIPKSKPLWKEFYKAFQN